MSARSKTSTRSARRGPDFEKEFIRKREKDFQHQQTWGGQVKYYEKFEKANTRYENWTSPRYYETQTKKVEEINNKREKEKNLEKRRDKLRKLLAEEEQSYQIELMVKNRDKFLYPRSRTEEGPSTGVLKEVNLGIQELEEDRRRHEAEIKLYHQWRENNPIVKNHERLRNNRDLKLAWLDQQIEKRMEREKAEEECKRILAERKKIMEEQKEREEKLKKETEEKNRQLQEDIQRQMQELQKKQEEADELQKLEFEEIQRQMQLIEIEEKQKKEEQRRKEKEITLYNIRQHKLKLKQKARMIEENLQCERRLIQDLKDSRIAEKIENEARKQEIKQAMDQFLKYTQEQQELEKHRRQYLDFMFDSEAKYMYEKQQEIWDREEAARSQLLKDVLITVKTQIEEKIERNKLKQEKILEEREMIMKSIKEYDEKIKKLKEEEVQKREQWKKEVDEQIKERMMRRKELKLLEQRKIEDDLDAVRKEEERLRREILEIQKRPYGKPTRRSRIFL